MLFSEINKRRKPHFVIMSLRDKNNSVNKAGFEPFFDSILY
jgi:hypothetical protein